MFTGDIPKKLNPPHVKAEDALNDKWGGIFGAGLFGVTIVLLVGLSAGGLLEHHPWGGVWIVVLPAALCMLTWDCVGDIKDPGRKERAREKDRQGMKEVERPEAGLEGGGQDMTNEKRTKIQEPAEDVHAEGKGLGEKTASSQDGGNQLSVSGASDQPTPALEGDTTTITNTPSDPAVHTSSKEETPAQASTRTPGSPAQRQEFPLNVVPLSFLARKFPTPIDTLGRMPWNLVPFAFSMFILVEGLQHTGWIRVFGGWWAAWVRADSTGVAGSVWLMGVLSVLGCNVSVTLTYLDSVYYESELTSRSLEQI